MMKVFLSSDHGGYHLRKRIREYLEAAEGYEVEDLGCKSEESCDYPAFGKMLGESVVQNPETLGIIICGSGVGVSIAANKVHGVRAVLANSVELATLGRQHNGANVLALGERTQAMDDPLQIVDAFLQTAPDMTERHERRRTQLDRM